MDISNLPTNILEKVIIQGFFFTIFTVCKKWYEIAKSIRHNFNEIVFDLTKDDPEQIKKNPDQVFLYRSQMYDKQGIRIQKEYLEKRNLVRLLNNFSSVNTLNIVFDVLYYIKKQDIGEIKYKNLAKDIFTENLEEFVGLFNTNSYKTFLKKVFKTPKKYKNINIKIKDYSQQIEKVDENIVINCEIKMLMELLSKFELINKFEKFTFNAPNDIYLIYDKDKEILIIRFGDYEKYDFPSKKTKFDQLFYRDEGGDHVVPTENIPRYYYSLNCFFDYSRYENEKLKEDNYNECNEIECYKNEDDETENDESEDDDDYEDYVESDTDNVDSENETDVDRGDKTNTDSEDESNVDSDDEIYEQSDVIIYPLGFFEFKYSKFLNKVKKLILINSGHIEYLFDLTLHLSRKHKSKQIKYICLDQEKSQNYSYQNFEIITLKEKTDVYSFDQIYLNYHEMF